MYEFERIGVKNNIIDYTYKGFFADAFHSAIIEFAKSKVLPGVSGWVAGHTGTEGTPGPCAMYEVTEKKYNTTLKRMNRNFNRADSYHLQKFNCQDWATMVLR